VAYCVNSKNAAILGVVAIYSLADFARIAKVSKPAVTQAVRRGKIIKGSDGKIDSDNPLNAAYLGEKLRDIPILPRQKNQPPAEPSEPKAEKPKSEKSKPPKGDAVSPPNHPTLSPAEREKMMREGRESLNLDRSRKIADLDLKRRMAEGHAIRNAQRKGQLVERDLVRQRFNAFDASLKTNFRDMPRRVSAQIHAIAASGSARDVEAYLEREIGQAIARAVEASKSLGLS
jgi:hypothetical protein